MESEGHGSVTPKASERPLSLDRLQSNGGRVDAEGFSIPPADRDRKPWDQTDQDDNAMETLEG